MRMKASRPTRKNDPTRATYSVLFEHIQTGLALRRTTKHAAVWRMQHAVSHSHVKTPQKGDRHLEILGGLPWGTAPVIGVV
jgi:hypothetical protein